MATLTPYSNFPKALLNKEIDFDTDDIRGALCSSSYTPNKDTHDYWNDITNELATGGGYTANGQTIGGCAISVVAANSWSVARANSTAYAAGDIVRPATGNGYLYQAATAGTSGGSIPAYPTTIGGTVTDGGVTWVCIGRAAIVVDGNDVSWDPSTISGARFLVVYDRTPSTDATRPLIGYVDFVTDQASNNGPLSVVWNNAGMLVFVIA